MLKKDIQIVSYNGLLEDSIRKHWNRNSLSDYGLETLKYKDVAAYVEELHILFETCGIEKGDKIALCGRNVSRWGVAYVAILTYGAVAVPILHEFHPQQVHDIVNHSEAKLLFVGDLVWRKLNGDAMGQLQGIISLADYSVLLSRSEKLSNAGEHLLELFGERYPKEFTPDCIHYHRDKPDELALINYTSGTTSNSKGVMIPYRALWSNYDFAVQVMGDHLKPGCNTLSMLPLAHMYGMAFEFSFEFLWGMHIHFLTRAASPTVLLGALGEIKPSILIVVPLILEKVVRRAILPRISSPTMKLLLRTPVVGNKIRTRLCKALTDALGGRFYQVIIGGAALNQEIEMLLHSIGFKYTIGYGATECAPIICYEDYKMLKLGSCGKPVVNMELKINSEDSLHNAGEILTRGLNVMLGYYKNEEATRQTLDEEGWYHTGDLGIQDEDGNVYIKGRIKNMLLGANGQNIYPEEIEDKLSNMPLVTECVVIQKDEKLYGLVYPDVDAIKKDHLTEEKVNATMDENRKTLNQLLPTYSQLHGIKIMKEEFQKTPKKSIKRYLYMDEEI